jgi:hypothetical protein
MIARTTFPTSLEDLPGWCCTTAHKLTRGINVVAIVLGTNVVAIVLRTRTGTGTDNIEAIVVRAGAEVAA